MLPVIYSMSVSLDGFIAGPDGDIGWSATEAEESVSQSVPARSASLITAPSRPSENGSARACYLVADGSDCHATA